MTLSSGVQQSNKLTERKYTKQQVGHTNSEDFQACHRLSMKSHISERWNEATEEVYLLVWQ